jgi:hypothetical protein
MSLTLKEHQIRPSRRSTGLFTAPNLDFRITQRGQFKNSKKLGLPPADPVAKKNRAEFSALRKKWLPRA